MSLWCTTTLLVLDWLIVWRQFLMICHRSWNKIDRMIWYQELCSVGNVFVTSSVWICLFYRLSFCNKIVLLSLGGRLVRTHCIAGIIIKKICFLIYSIFYSSFTCYYNYSWKQKRYGIVHHRAASWIINCLSFRMRHVVECIQLINSQGRSV